VAKRKPAPTTLRQSLEAALVANPDDLAAHSAYADHLIEQGDPRGEFIQVQLALEDPTRPATERKQLQKREAALWKQHGAAWLGPFAAHVLPELYQGRYAASQYRMARGWLDFLGINILTTPLTHALVHAPQAALLQALTIGAIEDFRYRDEEGPEPYPELDALMASPNLGNLRVFRLGGAYPLGEHDFRYSFGPDYHSGLLDLVQAMPRIEELSVDCDFHGIDQLFALKTLTRLRTLQLVFQANYPLKGLAANPALRHLESVLFHPAGLPRSRQKSAIPLAEVKALLRAPHLTRLTTLRLHMTDMGDRGCAEIVKSGILKRLKVLDLAFGCMTDAGAATLAACPELRNLQQLDVTRNALSAQGVRALAATGVTVLADDQHHAGATEYLYEGDCE